MNGTLLLRRSVSIALASSFFLVAACGVEFNGTFEGDADIDGAAPHDVASDSNASDRAPDIRDTPADGSSDVSAPDRSTSDGSPDDRGGVDATMDPVSEVVSGDA